MRLGEDIPVDELRRLVPDLDARPGERWRLAPRAPGVAVSSEGRAVVLPAERDGRNFRGRVLDLGGACPRIPAGGRKRVPLAREVLGAFVREAPRGKRVEHLNGAELDCRLANLRWASERTLEVVDRFLANDRACLDGLDMEHAAIRLDVSLSVLVKALSTERRRLGTHAPQAGPRTPPEIAEEIREARGAVDAGDVPAPRAPERPTKHGTAYAYRAKRCRCRRCKDWNTANARKARDRRAAGPIPDHVHGTPGGWANYRCKCGRCVEALRESRRLSRKLRAA